MEPKKTRRTGRARPEAKIQTAIIMFLRARDWFVKSTHGGPYQAGFPDLFASHTKYRQRWIEVKLPGFKGSHFTPAQLEIFPQMCGHGAGVWILTAATDEEYQKLFGPPNWHVYLPIMRRGL